MRWFLERIVRRVDQQYYLSKCVHYSIGGLSIKYQSSESAQLIYIHKISIVGVFPINIHRRVVHKIDYRSLSTIYIGGLSTVKNKDLCLEMVFIHGRMHVKSYVAQRRHTVMLIT